MISKVECCSESHAAQCEIQDILKLFFFLLRIAQHVKLVKYTIIECVFSAEDSPKTYKSDETCKFVNVLLFNNYVLSMASQVETLYNGKTFFTNTIFHWKKLSALHILSFIIFSHNDLFHAGSHAQTSCVGGVWMHSVHCNAKRFMCTTHCCAQCVTRECQSIAKLFQHPAVVVVIVCNLTHCHRDGAAAAQHSCERHNCERQKEERERMQEEC